MSSPVTQDDVDSVKDVPIEEALNYLEMPPLAVATTNKGDRASIDVTIGPAR